MDKRIVIFAFAQQVLRQASHFNNLGAGGAGGQHWAVFPVMQVKGIFIPMRRTGTAEHAFGEINSAALVLCFAHGGV